MAVDVEALRDKILVHRIPEQETVRNGIFIPDTAKEKPQEGEVLSVGDGHYESGVLIPIVVKVGDHILFGKYSGTEIKVDNEEYLILREDEILARVKTVEVPNPVESSRAADAESVLHLPDENERYIGRM